jgi:CheY-like chemotaxis protein
MALFNHATKEVTAKLVYYGPGLCGKTTNLQWIHQHLSFQGKGKLVSLATQTDRTLFFDFLPGALGTIRGMRLRIQVYTVPGQVFYEATRRMVLKGCDAVVFVADSQAAMLDANAESQRGLRQNLLVNEIDSSIPQVVQYNKRDLPTALPVEVLEARLNPRGVPAFEAVATRGVGVEATLTTVTKLLFEWLARYYGGSPSDSPTSADRAPAPGAALPSPASALASARHTPAGVVVEPPPSPTDPPPPSRSLGPGQWLYLLDGRERGPVDTEELIDLVLTTLPENTRVWQPELDGWVLASEAPRIAEEIPPPIPLPGVARDVYGDEEMPDFNTVPPMLRSVLIADEDDSFRKYLAMPLVAQGFTVYEAADGAAAWQLAVQNRPWMILADISMPEVDGFEFCRRVRSHPMLSRLPLLFISGSDKYKERYRALQIGADDFLSKSMPVRELLMRIQLLLTRYSDLAAAEPQAGAKDVAGAFQGRVEVFGAPALLQMCAQGRLTGLLTSLAEDARNTATVMGFRDGDIVSATVGAVTGTEAVHAFLAWKRGSFKFTPGDPGAGEPLAQSVEHLLLEGCRLLDESVRNARSEEPDGVS